MDNPFIIFLIAVLLGTAAGVLAGTVIHYLLGGT